MTVFLFGNLFGKCMENSNECWWKVFDLLMIKVNAWWLLMLEQYQWKSAKNFERIDFSRIIFPHRAHFQLDISHWIIFPRKWLMFQKRNFLGRVCRVCVCLAFGKWFGNLSCDCIGYWLIHKFHFYHFLWLLSTAP